ncbi:MAG: polysaccharide biosynthesis/export family protein [Sedimentisphaerales bacterium]|nr:polysaccharide biosynthesis/export family protein [Sedimentisphaerales bacterium]
MKIAVATVIIILTVFGCAQQPTRVYKVASGRTIPTQSQPPRYLSTDNSWTQTQIAQRQTHKPDAIVYGPAGAQFTPTPPITAVLAQNSPGYSGNDEYHLGPDDVVEIKVFQLLEPDKETVLEAKVDRQGCVYLPMLNQVQVSGMTCRQLQQDLLNRLGSNYIRNPKVSVALKLYGSKKVMVLGCVRKAGMVMLVSDAAPLLDVISMAGGIQNKAAPHIEILRGAFDPSAGLPAPITTGLSGGNDYTREIVPISQLFAENSTPLNPLIYPGDVVSVPDGEEGYIYVSGEVEQPGAKPFRRPLSILQAVTSAGGSTNIAAEKKCRILRQAPDGREKIILVDIGKIREGQAPNLLMARNDTIIVPVDPVKKFFDDLDKMFRRGVVAGVDMTYDAGAQMGIPTRGAAVY